MVSFKEQLNGSCENVTSSLSSTSNLTTSANPASIEGTSQHSLALSLPRTDLSLWRLKVSNGGRQVWHYLTSKEAETWPQSTEDKYWLGLPPNLPELKEPKTPLDSAENCWEFYQNLQSQDGHFAGEYGGPLFLIPGLIIGMYVTKTAIPQEWKIEIVRYLANKVNEDGGWGLHTEGPSTVFGTSCNYVVLRILGLSSDHPLCLDSRKRLHELGGATSAPAWGKFWLAVLNVYDWSGMDPIPPELWCLPDWLPIHPRRWWVQARMVYLPMGYLYGKRFRMERNALVDSLRQELYVKDYDSIDWASQRGNINEVDAFAPHTKVLRGLMNCLSVYESCSIPPLRKAGIARAYELLKQEDENTSYQCLAPVNKMLNLISRYMEIELEGKDSHFDSSGNNVMKCHREKLKDFMWMSKAGLMMNGTNGSQLWDTSFLAQALVSSSIASNPKYKDNVIRVLEWVDQCQIREDPKHYKVNYRFSTKGAWPFSTKEQGYTVTDCTGEGMKAVLMLQSIQGMPQLVNEERLRDSVDLLLTMQNPSGGFASFGTIDGAEQLEWINPGSCFADIMIEHDYPECTTSVVTALLMFKKVSDYRSNDIDRVVAGAVRYLLKAQRPDGSWFGSWAICFTYATMFALESLSLVGMRYENSKEVRKACDFLIGKQKEDGGWGETFESCTTGEYVQAPASLVVQTSWVIISLIHARYHEYVSSIPIERAVGLLMRRQASNGSFEQESIEGIFNRNCSISYPNFKHCFTLWALGMAHKALGGEFQFVDN